MNKPLTISLRELEVSKLPSPPQVLIKLVELCNQEQYSYRDLIQLVAKDPALTAKVVAAYNSTAEGRLDDEHLFEQAVRKLGGDSIKALAAASAVQQHYTHMNHRQAEVVYANWWHSLSSAVVAKHLAIHLNYRAPEEAYFAALTHDIGQLCFVSSKGDAFANIYLQSQDVDEQVANERASFGLDHCELGATLLAQWNLPAFVQDAVLHHHAVSEKMIDAHMLVKLVNFADLLTVRNDMEVDDGIVATAEELFDINKFTLVRLIERVQDELVDIAELFDINIEDFVGDGCDQAEKEGLLSVHINSLAVVAKESALLGVVRQQLMNSNDDVELVYTIQKNIAALFSVTQSMVFLYDAAHGAFLGRGLNEQAEFINELKLSTDPTRSLVSGAVANNKPIDSFSVVNENLNVIDQQIIRLGGASGILVVPFTLSNEPIGAVVLAVDESQLAGIKESHGLLLQFSAEVSQSICALRDRSDKSRQAEVERKLFYETMVKETVHEISDPLSVVENYLPILNAKLAENNVASDELNIIGEEIKRASELIQRLDAKAKLQDDPQELLDVNKLITDLINFYQASLYKLHSIESQLELDDTIPPLMMDQNYIKQVLTHLIKNAVEALGDAGVIYVTSRDAINVDGAEYIEIKVMDNGPGIPHDVQANLFKPVISQKGRGHQGLGLSIVKNLVHKMGGTISCRSEASKGTSFHVLLPRVLERSEHENNVVSL